MGREPGRAESILIWARLTSVLVKEEEEWKPSRLLCNLKGFCKAVGKSLRQSQPSEAPLPPRHRPAVCSVWWGKPMGSVVSMGMDGFQRTATMLAPW